MDKILIIGCSGLLGSRLIEIGKRNYKLFGTYFTHPVTDKNVYQIDITKREKVFSLFEKIKPDCVINTAAITDLEYAETHSEETWQLNVDGVKNVAEASAKENSKIIFLSTDQVFDGKKTNYTEVNKPRPLNYYAKTKVIAENVLDVLDADYVIGRTSGLYGVGGSGKLSFAMWVINKLSKKEQINCVTDQYNNPTFADNLAEMLYALYEKDVKGIFHTAGADLISRFEWAVKIAEIFGFDKALIKEITTKDLNWKAKRPEKVNLLKDKIKKVTGINPLGIDEGTATLKEQLEAKK
jgi:dTDP-4-dehydrorhamnose reductase